MYTPTWWKKVQRWTDKRYSMLCLAAFAATEFNEIFGQTAASVCESSPAIQWLTPSPFSVCCWWLGKTKTDQQVPYCAVCRPPFGLGARTVRHLFVSSGFTGPWTRRKSQSLKRWTTSTHLRGCLPEILLLMLHIIGGHTYFQRVNRWPLSGDSTVCIERSVGTGQTCKTKQLTVWLKCNQPLQRQNLDLENTS